MNDTELRILKERQEALRERHWDPAVRWRVIQDTITWAERQLTVHRNVPVARKREEMLKLAALARFRRNLSGDCPQKVL